VLDFEKKGEYDIQPIVVTPDRDRQVSQIVIEITRIGANDKGY
jgi:hypothetical protein